MKAVILCGGKGTRYNKGKSNFVLKPLIKINKKSILSRIISIYSKQGVKDIFLLGGYKFEELKKFSIKYKKINVTALNTGLNTNTAGRLLKAKKYIGKEDFFFTYGDSFAKFNLKKALKLKRKNKKNFIITLFDYPIPYGVLNSKKNILKIISEKKLKLTINAGFYVLDQRIFDYIKDYDDSFEKKTINKVINLKKINFVTMKIQDWMPLDTKGDLIEMSNNLK